jgi:hypothetical protein
MFTTAALTFFYLAGSPVYLACDLQEGATATSITLTIVEDDQTVTLVQNHSGRTISKRSIFSPSEVKIPDDESIWIVDRTTLGIKRIVKIGTARWEDIGQCRLVETPPKRAF